MLRDQESTRNTTTVQTANITSTGYTSRIDAYLCRLASATRKTLPELNDAIEAGLTPAETLHHAFRPWVTDISALVGQPLGTVRKWEARQFLQLYGFWLSSMERHSQAAGGIPGQTIAEFTHLDDALDLLGQIAQHPPRDSHYSYWLWNQGETAMIFTGDPQERIFNEIVNLTHQLHSLSCDALRPLCQGDVSPFSLHGQGSLAFATCNTLAIRDRFRAFMKKVDEHHWALTPHFFMTRMRTYLTTYPIKGLSWGGVNATHLVAQAQMDYLLGTTDEHYRHTVGERFRYMTAEDQVALQRDMLLPSLTTRILAHLGLSAHEMTSADPETVDQIILVQPDPILETLVRYVDLIDAAAKLTATHWSLIVNYLIKPAQHLTPEVRNRLPVDPTKGVSDQGFENPQQIRDMRRHHPVVTPLVEAIRQRYQVLG